MNRLPTEILPLIIKQVDSKDLCACSLVNKNFYTATLPILWRWYIETDASAQCALLDLLEHTTHPIGKYVRVMQLRSHYWNKTTLTRLMPYLGQVEELTIKPSEHVDKLGIYGSHLLKLTLWDTHLTGLPCALTQLTLIDCTSRFLPLTVTELCIYNKRRSWLPTKDLQRLDLIDLTFVDKAMAPVFFSMDLSWPRLTRLYLADLDHIGDAQLIPFLQAHPQLQDVTLRKSVMTDATLDALSLPKLATLNLDFCLRLTALAVRRLVLRCPCLGHLSLVNSHIYPTDFPETGNTCVTSLAQFDSVDLDTIRRTQ